MPPLDPSLAVVSPFKLRGYLLSATHPLGGHKAVFFRALGYRPESPQLLERDLISLLHSNAKLAELTEFSQKYTSEGLLTGPNGRKGAVLAIWIILSGEKAPRFVTAYPGNLEHDVQRT